MTGTIAAELRWTGGETFEAVTGNHRTAVDGESERGPSPMQLLALGVGGCMGIDVAHILTRMRTVPDTLQVRVECERAEEPPRRFTVVKMEFELTGEVPEANLERALQLSRDRYCSAWASLRPDTELRIHSRINSQSPA